MGSYAPSKLINHNLEDKIINKIIKPTLTAINDMNQKYNGFLYAGLMIDSNGNVKVLEFNCRFGDPETQPIMMRLQTNLAELCIHATQDTLDKVKASWDDRTSLGVVMAAKGYPESYQMGDPITLPITSSDTKVFHAGTRLEGSQILSNGGRVLCATSVGKDIEDAQKKAYEPENLINKMVVCVNNLKERKMRFGTSEGMILAAGDDDIGIFILSPDQGAEPGMQVR